MTFFIDEKQRFSNSALWTAQREYYETEGIEAWTADVPFYVTSNPFIANSYANVSIRFIQDWIRKNPTATEKTFYFLELGTGPGQFSYYILKTLHELKEKLGLQSLKICYIMSDFTEKNIEFWKQHERLKPYLDSGSLDFAKLDLENDSEIKLKNTGLTLSKGSLQNPLIVIANYIFDTLRTDIFTVADHKLSESLVSLKTDNKNLSDGKPKNWEKVSVEHTDVEVQGAYYDNPHYNAALETYREKLNKSHFLFPIATLEALDRLDAISNQQMLILASDKAYSTFTR